VAGLALSFGSVFGNAQPAPPLHPALTPDEAAMKKAWKAGGESVAVYTASSSGPAQFTLVTRYKQGLKERNAGFRKPFKDRYEGANGTDSFEDFLDVLREYLTDAWSELLFYRADLSSK
jgi:hypothetical protein